jgi:elongation factor G
MPAIEKGVRSVLSDGAVAGYPLTGVKVEVYDGKFHAVDSKEIAFVTAGKRAFVDAIRKANPVLLEPFVELEVTVPSGYMGDIAGDMSTKRGRVQDTEMLGSDTCVIRATAPLGEVQNYANELKSMTGGAGTTPWIQPRRTHACARAGRGCRGVQAKQDRNRSASS